MFARGLFGEHREKSVYLLRADGVKGCLKCKSRWIRCLSGRWTPQLQLEVLSPGKIESHRVSSLLGIVYRILSAWLNYRQRN